MPNLYLPGAQRRQLDDAPMAGDGGARTIWHVTWDKNATADRPADLVPFSNLADYFAGTGKGVAPHVLWNPFTGETVQFFSATSRSKSVVNAPGGVETNRKGDVCIQIESLFFPYCRVDGRVYATLADTPCKGLPELLAWLRSWGVPDVWPMGEPTWTARRDAAVWNSRSGHYGHSQVPENDHTDPGPMPPLFAGAPVALPPGRPTVPWPGRVLKLTSPRMHGNDILAFQHRMAERTWSIGTPSSTYGDDDGTFGPLMDKLTRAFQRDKGLAQDGEIGRDTWTAAFRTDNIT